MLGVALTACAGTSGDTATPSGTSTASPTASPSASSEETPTMPPTQPPSDEPTFAPTPVPSGKPDQRSTTVSGTISLGVEAGCLMLNAGKAQYQLVGGDRNLLRAGRTVKVVGVIRTDLLTTCQQGTPLVVQTAELA
jgi:hypothetical protein